MFKPDILSFFFFSFFYLLLRQSISDHYLKICGNVTCSRTQRKATRFRLEPGTSRLYHCASPSLVLYQINYFSKYCFHRVFGSFSVQIFFYFVLLRYISKKHLTSNLTCCILSRNPNETFFSSITMQSNELAHLSKVYSVIAGACIPIFHCI